MGTCAKRAQEAIRQAAANIPAEATLKERMEIIDAAYPFGTRDHFPYKAWLKERRAYLVPYGYRQAKSPGELFSGWERDPTTGRPIIP